MTRWLVMATLTVGCSAGALRGGGLGAGADGSGADGAGGAGGADGAGGAGGAGEGEGEGEGEGGDGADGGADGGRDGADGAPCWDGLPDMDGDGAPTAGDCIWAAICPAPAADMQDGDGDGDVDLDDCRALLRGPAGAAGADGANGADGAGGADGADGADGRDGAPCWADAGDQDGDGDEDSWDCVWAAICPAAADGMDDADGDDDVDLDDCRELLRGPAGRDGGPGGGGGEGEGEGGGPPADFGPGGDLDGDGIVNAEDNCPFTPNDGQTDVDLDGLGDDCDPDRDGDGHANRDDCWPDEPHAFPGSGPDDTCDGVDDDCDGQLDEDFVADRPCDTGVPGVCAAGTGLCINGVPFCEPDAAPADEVCDRLDNDCDGIADEVGAAPDGAGGVGLVDDDGNGLADECERGHMTEGFVPQGSHPIWCNSGPNVNYRDFGQMPFDDCDDLANRTGTQYYAGQAWDNRPGPGWLGHYDEQLATIANRGNDWSRTERIAKAANYTCRLARVEHRSEPDANAWGPENRHIDAAGRRWHWWRLTNQTHSQCMSAADRINGRLLNSWAIGQGRVPSMAPPTHWCHAGPVFNADGQGINSDQRSDCYIGFYE